MCKIVVILIFYIFLQMAQNRHLRICVIKIDQYSALIS
nr:MAG TPA: hypothetical protein [Caudoviricetes sp.]